MIYFDNAATTFIKPRSVYTCVNKYLKKYAGNPGRSSHKIAAAAAEYVYVARERVASLFSVADPAQVVFTMNATYALNMAIKSLICESGHIIISDVEHNSVLRPVIKLCEEFNGEYSVFDSNADNIFFEIERHIRKDTKAVISSIMSNVDGREISLFALSAIKQKHNLKLIIDASQAAGHKKIDLSNVKYDAIAMPGHKGLYGIQGAGICIFNGLPPRNSFVEGGSGFDSKNPYMPPTLPEHFEAGTLPTPSIAALSEGIKFIEKISVDEIEFKIDLLDSMLIDRLSDIRGIDVYGGKNGITSFILSGVGVEELAERLNYRGIYLRSGFHCAPLAHRTIGTFDSGTARVSFSYFNNVNEVDEFWSALKEISFECKKR